MSGPVTIGVDVATAGVRAVAMAVTTRAVLASASRKLPAPQRDGRGHSESDANEWWPNVVAALVEVTAQLPRGGAEVQAVAVAATSGTIVAVDEAERPVSPALMYDDRRGAPYNAKAAGLGGDRWARLGLAPSATAALGRIAWLRDTVPETAAIRHTPELIGARLTGATVATDSSHALKSGYDALARQWPTDVFDALGVSADFLPDVVAPTSVLGEVCRTAAEATGLPLGCLVVAGMTDGCAGQLAAGACEPGQFVGILGTTYVLKGVSADLVADPTGAMYSHRHPQGWWLPGGASNTGGEALADSTGLAALDAAAADLGPARTLAYPLRRQGERFPFVAASARGFELGEPESAAEAHRARLEGVAFVERLALDHVRRLGLEVTAPLFTAGGGSRSPLWNQIRASVSGLSLRVSESAETGYGAALLAAAALLPGGLSEACRDLPGATSLVDPDPAERAALEDSYRRFCMELHGRGWIDDELLTTAVR
ncbi:Sugar (pentulose or hexulose) kinase [Amycolatopsis marina]|uniref:Sugar (Pentulose or hexulose) kinase n=1 Tax=Amycolatopsis marina TaxID=490629 RepID=A0A1I0Y6W9_9PSEU|nr:FGGY family carbohydrate kinase [Amycolatopsis marina]SFB08218.1 Sugar (pentulose or hexulose) kinase [Amycolatopsis marina]